MWPQTFCPIERSDHRQELDLVHHLEEQVHPLHLLFQHRWVRFLECFGTYRYTLPSFLLGHENQCTVEICHLFLYFVRPQLSFWNWDRRNWLRSQWCFLHHRYTSLKMPSFQSRYQPFVALRRIRWCLLVEIESRENPLHHIWWRKNRQPNSWLLFQSCPTLLQQWIALQYTLVSKQNLRWLVWCRRWQSWQVYQSSRPTMQGEWKSNCVKQHARIEADRLDLDHSQFFWSNTPIPWALHSH